VRILTMNRPEALNALNTETLQEMGRAIFALSEDPGARILILTGGGEKAFIAGADIAEMRAMDPSRAVEFGRLGQEVTKRIERLPMPVIAAVNGFALGGGTEMALACDFILCSDHAVFGLPEVTLGVMPGFGGNVRLARHVGLPMAKELVFSGKKINAAEALRVRLVNAVHPKADLLPKTVELAEMISKNSLSAIRAAKLMLEEVAESIGIERKLDSEALHFGALFGSADQKEGMNAFAEKRKPRFAGLE